MCIKGVFPVLAAPFKNNGDINFNDLRKLVNFQLFSGANGVTLFGFATEFYKLSGSEKIDMFKIVKDELKNRAPVIVTVNEQSTRLAVSFAKEIEEIGADYLMLLPPFIMSISKTSFLKHVQTVAQEVNIPIILQYSPVETGTEVGTDTLVRLMESKKNLHYLKIESKPPGPIITKILDESTISPGIFVGYAGLQMIDALLRGAVGVMPGSSLVDVYTKIYNHYILNEIEAAVELHGKLVPLINYIFQSIEMIIKWEKVILKRRHIISTDYCRTPNYEPDQYENNLFEILYSNLCIG